MKAPLQCKAVVLGNDLFYHVRVFPRTNEVLGIFLYKKNTRNKTI